MNSVKIEYTERQKVDFEQRPDFQMHIAALAYRVLAKIPHKVFIVDRFHERKAIQAGQFLALATLFAEYLKKSFPERRIGVVLPPSIGAYVINLGISLAGKVAVNLNFMASTQSIEKAIEIADLKTMITTKDFQKNIQDFPWSFSTIDFAAWFQAIPLKAFLRRIALIQFMPSALAMRYLGIPTEGKTEEAALLFTSGSSNIPKGVVFTHQNILANVFQIKALGILNVNDSIMASLPIFHSFGFTVAMWYPLLSGMQVVTYASPLDFHAISKAIRDENVSVHIGTPTLLRNYIKRVAPEDLKSLKAVIAGAEKTPPALAQMWKNKFNSYYLEGYGLTETAPVVAVNLYQTPDYCKVQEDFYREGSVGKLLPGIEARITDVDTGHLLDSSKIGMLELRGPNIFPYYLDDPVHTQEAFHDDWFITGDLAYFDAQGFLYIEGRFSRFSKIGGEMVSHDFIEQLLLEIFESSDKVELNMVVVSRPDESKGEALILLTTLNLTLEAIRTKLLQRNVPILWIPKMIQKVDAIPLLPSGKIDLRACRKLAGLV